MYPHPHKIREKKSNLYKHLYIFISNGRNSWHFYSQPQTNKIVNEKLKMKRHNI